MYVLSMFVILGGIYILPSWWAAIKNKKGFLPIFLINIFLSWTLIAWPICMIWAVKGQEDSNNRNKGKLAACIITAFFFLFFSFSEKEKQEIKNMIPEQKQEYDKQQEVVKEKRDREAEAQAAEDAALAYKEFCSNKVNAFVLSQQFVERRLKSPSTARFPSITSDEVSVVIGKDCTATVWGYVDSQNGFGAMLRSHYRVMLKGYPYNDGWKLISINIE